MMRSKFRSDDERDYTRKQQREALIASQRAEARALSNARKQVLLVTNETWEDSLRAGLYQDALNGKVKETGMVGPAVGGVVASSMAREPFLQSLSRSGSRASMRGGNYR